MCLYPKVIKNKKYEKTIKNRGNIPPVYDQRALGVAVGCGNCMECRKQKAREWRLRLTEDIRKHTNGIMITLTFSTESLKKIIEEHPTPLDGYERENWIATKAVHLWRERWRKEYKISPRHWLITELGTTRYEHIHLHGIIWTPKIEAWDMRRSKLIDITISEIKRTWDYGYIWAGDYVSTRTINYMTKYVHKMDLIHQKYKPIILTSPGIGGNYIEYEKYPYCEEHVCINPRTRKWYKTVVIKHIKGPAKPGRWMRNKFKEAETCETYKSSSGHEIGMPAYWRNKIYSDDEREMLWMNLLNKETRYVNGEKIDVSKGMEQYFKVLEYHRQKNKKLKYGTSEKRWDREVYERERRNLIWKARIENNQKPSKE